MILLKNNFHKKWLEAIILIDYIKFIREAYQLPY